METTTTPPEFALVMRGYDRFQVDDYVARQATWLAEAQARVEAAESAAREAHAQAADLRSRIARGERKESTTAPKSVEALGERVGRILQVALDAAEEVRTEADLDARSRRAEAERTLVEARAMAASVTSRAEEEARTGHDQILAEARAEAERVRGEAARREQEVEARVAALAARRSAALAELTRVHQSLARALQDEPDAVTTDEFDVHEPNADETVAITGVIDLRAEANGGGGNGGGGNGSVSARQSAEGPG